MATTLLALRLLVGRLTQPTSSSTTTSTGTASALIDTALKNYPDGWWDDAYVRITSGTYSGDVRRINTHTQSTGTLVPYQDFGGAIDLGVTYELYKFWSPSDVDQGIIDSVRPAYPHLHRKYEWKDAVTGSRLLNGSFEDWNSITAATIAFVDGGANPDTITDSGSGFVAAGFVAGQTVSISGAANAGNNKTFTLVSVVAGTLTVATGSLTAEAAGATVTIQAATNWTVKGTLANLCAAKETTLVWHGAASCRLEATGAATYSQAVSAMVAALLEGYTFTFYAWVLASVANTARLHIIDADGTTYGDYHTGSGIYERLSVSKTVTTLSSFGFQIAGAATVYVDDAWIEGGPDLYEYALPTGLAIERQAPTVEIQDDRRHLEGSYTGISPLDYEIITLSAGTKLLRFYNRPADGYHLRVRGLGYLSALSAQTDTVEVDAPQTEILVYMAAIKLLGQYPLGSQAMDEATRAQKLSELSMGLAFALRNYSMAAPKRGVIVRPW